MQLIVDKKEVEGVKLSGAFRKIFLGSFVMLIIGPPGVGKTTFLLSILSNKSYYMDKFDKIIYFSPSEIKGINFTDKNHRTHLEPDFIQHTTDLMNQHFKGKQSNLLVVVDDLMDEFEGKQKQISAMVNNRRHLLKQGTVSYVIITQKFNTIPTWVRVAINLIVMYKVNGKQLEVITKQMALPIDLKELRVLNGQMGKHQFIIVNLEKGTIHDFEFNSLL